MTIQEFGNAFKQAVAETAERGEVKPERVQKIYPRQRNDNKIEGSEEILNQEYNYPNVQNDVDGSVIIDGWWDVLMGTNEALKDDQHTRANLNRKNANLRGRTAVGPADALFNLRTTLTHGRGVGGFMEDEFEINRANSVEEWRNGQPNFITDAEAGYMMGKLFALYWDSWDITTRGWADRQTIQIFLPNVVNRVFNKYVDSASKLNCWRGAFKTAADGGIDTNGGGDVAGVQDENDDNGTRGDLLKNGTSGSADDDEEKIAIIDAWLEWCGEQEITIDILTPAHIREMYSKGWDPCDIIKHNDNVRAFHPVTLNPLNGVAEINAVIKYQVWRQNWNDIAATNTGGGNGIDRNPNDMDNDEKDAWLNVRNRLFFSGGSINAAYSNALKTLLNNEFDRAHIKALYRQGWNENDFMLNLEGNNLAVFNYATGEWVQGFDDIQALNGPQTSWRGAVNDADVVNPTRGGGDNTHFIRGSLQSPHDDNLIDLWLERVALLADDFLLTPIQVEELHRLGFNPNDINFDLERGDIWTTKLEKGGDVMGIDNILAYHKGFRFRTQFKSQRFANSRLDRNFAALTGDEAANIDPWANKGIDGATAGLLYNLGIDHAGLHNDPNDAGGTGARAFNLGGHNYDLTDADDLRNFVAAKAQAVNPLTDAAWNAAAAQALTAEELTLITDNALDTAAAKYAGALLLAHLRAIKQATGNGANYELNQTANYTGGTANGTAANWLARNQVAIDAALEAPITAAQLKALREFNQAHATDANSAHGKAWARANHADFNTTGGGEGLAAKVLNRAERLNTADFEGQFRTHAATVAGSSAHNGLATNNPANNSIIDQYNHDDITATDAVAAYDQGWIYGSEIKRDGAGGNPQISLNGGKDWVDFRWDTNARNLVVGGAPGGWNYGTGVAGVLSATDISKIAAYQLDGVNRWNPALNGSEKARIRKTNDVEASKANIRNARTTATNDAVWINDFKTAPLMVWETQTL
ncbi:MAG: hypothetical protein I3274_07045 [Candidatus Moeniiplasma glomeromycotorum]|nr:hypothetical protein [Candidatus Moeniiplasma glomeromycotorum]